MNNLTVEVIEEAGYKAALFGLSLNMKQHERKEPRDMEKVLQKLAHLDGGHNKTLEHIMLWFNVNAPRYWWSQADTYRISSKNSESTMHTILKRQLKQEDFEVDIPNEYLTFLNLLVASKNIKEVKRFLPEGYMQRRMWMMSYKTLRNIILQRRKHKLNNWQMFLRTIIGQISHPELLPSL